MEDEGAFLFLVTRFFTIFEQNKNKKNIFFSDFLMHIIIYCFHYKESLYYSSVTNI